jgi:DNA topoisomerase-1
VAKNVVIVESPAKAKTIERYLGKDFHVTASMGHVRDLPQKKLGVDIEHDFEPTYTVMPGKKKTMDALKKAAEGAETVYMATDLDREGEAIAWHLCEALGVDAKTVHRVTFNEITKPAIQAAFANPGLINMDKVQAQEARRILDRLVGYKLSPLLWKKVAKGLSAGRVQSVAVRLLVEREKEIRAFKPEEYWKILAHLHRTDDEKLFDALLTEVSGTKFEAGNEAAAKAVGEALRRARYRVLAIRRKRTEDKAPPPFITSQLQQSASTQLRFSTKKTMTIAQALYQGVELGSEGQVALITYMRTDSYHVAPAALEAARELITTQFGPEYIPEKANFFKSRGRAQEAHEAIRPTDVARTPESVAGLLGRDEARLYELIWKRFIASQMKPAVWDVTDVDIEAEAEAAAAAAGAPGVGAVKGLFKARGRHLVWDGHTRLTGQRLAEGEQELPELAEGEPLVLKELEETQHFTQPPPRYSEASLVKKLESLGIGRPSTYASIITTIQDRGYAEQKERRFFATDLGETVTDKLVQHFQGIMDYGFTSHMEDELDEVEEAKVGWLKVVREFWVPFSAALEQAGETMEATKNQAVEEAGPCPTCGAPLVKRFSKRGPFLGCSKYPDCKFTKPIDGEARPQPKPTEHKCEKCGGTMLLRISRAGEPFLGCEKYPECKNTMPSDKDGNPVKPQETGEVCPKCGAPMVMKNSRRGPFLGCSKYPDCKSTMPLDKEGKAIHLPTTDAVCEKCGKPMVVRMSRRGPFLGCSGYPKCRNALPMDGKKKEAAAEGAEGADGKPAKAKRAPAKPRVKPQETDRDCPECGAKLVIRSGSRGPFLGCSKYPKCRHTEDVPADMAT